MRTNTFSELTSHKKITGLAIWPMRSTLNHAKLAPRSSRRISFKKSWSTRFVAGSLSGRPNRNGFSFHQHVNDRYRAVNLRISLQRRLYWRQGKWVIGWRVRYYSLWRLFLIPFNAKQRFMLFKISIWEKRNFPLDQEKVNPIYDFRYDYKIFSGRTIGTGLQRLFWFRCPCSFTLK